METLEIENENLFLRGFPMKIKKDFWNGKKVFVTGHTGFKGTWLCALLKYLNANITGYALSPATKEGNDFFRLAELSENNGIIDDIRDYSALRKAFQQANPEIVFHLAAQPIVSIGYQEPLFTYETNVMGTVNLLECIRLQDSVKSVVIITTDKVYQNKEWVWGYRETDCLNGQDPYANSKSCAELATNSYKDSFFKDKNISVSTARAGNVIGGGDFALNRIIPDCIRAVCENKSIEIRHPESVRPYQHVLEPLFAYLLIAEKQYKDNVYAGSYNIGPNEENCVTTEKLANIFCKLWGEGANWQKIQSNEFHESRMLKLDCSLFKDKFKWQPMWDIETAVQKTVEFAKAWNKKDEAKIIMRRQIEEYLKQIITENP